MVLQQNCLVDASGLSRGGGHDHRLTQGLTMNLELCRMSPSAAEVHSTGREEWHRSTTGGGGHLECARDLPVAWDGLGKPLGSHATTIAVTGWVEIILPPVAATGAPLGSWYALLSLQ